MPPRKDRILVVSDTNVIIRYYLARSDQSANARTFRLWRDARLLQLLLTEEVLAEHLEVLTRLGSAQSESSGSKRDFARTDRSPGSGLGKRFTASRDPDDNLMLALAAAGRASS